MSKSSQIARLFNEQGGRCCYCTKHMALKKNKPNSVTREHITPRSHGGPSAMYNYAGACYSCNQARANKPLIIHLLELRNDMSK